MPKHVSAAFAAERKGSVKNTFSHAICAFATKSKAAIGFADRHKK
ncbi:hypothetical protein [Hominenteromicrobium sp.]